MLPGGIDPHTQLVRATDGGGVLDDWEAGSRAALAGGTTMLVELVLAASEETMQEAVAAWRQQGEETSCCDFALCVAVPPDTDDTAGQLGELVEQGVSWFQLFTGHKVDNWTSALQL